MLKQYESELLSAYADKELSGEELSYVQECLASSIDWREQLERLQKTKNLTTALPRILIPSDLIDILERKAKEHLESKEKGFIFRLFDLSPLTKQLMTGAFATAAVTVVSLGFYQHHQNSFIDLEPLLAVHSHTHANSLFGQNVVAAAKVSSQLEENAKE